MTAKGPLKKDGGKSLGKTTTGIRMGGVLPGGKKTLGTLILEGRVRRLILMEQTIWILSHGR